ncbi:hypothetical protein ON010_g2653 [Phytophthora cinnamomi]|nr:hypothetical protein ON010_g2653 [Phytophthora cinnamomi]
MHDAARLYDMWKKVMSKYGKACAKFFVSGQNSEEFFNFCEGNLRVLYLKACLDIKPELKDYVRGGMRQEDEVDSLNLQNSSYTTTAGRIPKWQDGILKTINRLADIVVGGRAPVATPAENVPATRPENEDVLFDRIDKLHHLIDQVKERQRKAELEGQTAAALANSLTLYQQCLQYYESCLTALE